MAAKKKPASKKMTSKKSSGSDTPRPIPGATNQNRVSGLYRDADLERAWKNASKSSQMEAFFRAVSGDKGWSSSLNRGGKATGRSGLRGRGRGSARGTLGIFGNRVIEN